MKKLQLLALTIFGIIIGGICLTTPTMAGECPEGSYQKNYTTSIAECNMTTVSQEESFPEQVKLIINWVVGLLGLAAVVVIIIGAVNYLTSNGDAGKVKKGRDTIIYGVVGLIIAVLAFAIVNFAIGALGN